METSEPRRFLNEAEKPTGKHYIILGMAWAGWLFDFYDLMMFSFLLIPINLFATLARNGAGGAAFSSQCFLLCSL
jgi:hypothetical protein